MRDVRMTPGIVVAVAILGMFLCSVALRAQEAPTGSTQAELDALRVENARLTAELKQAHERIADQKRRLNTVSAELTKLRVVRKEDPPATAPATVDAGRAVMAAAVVRSANNLKMIGHALLFYANAHDQKGPESLEELRRWADIPTSAFQSPLLNCRYQYLGYSNMMRANEVVAYEDSDHSTRNILFGDGSVAPFPAEQAKQIIAAGQK